MFHYSPRKRGQTGSLVLSTRLPNFLRKIQGMGLFITFEGGEGAGKSTQAKLLANHLIAAGVDVLLTREPGGTALGESIRALVMHGGEVDAKTEALLYAADRAHHVARVIAPALAAGKVVICDRFSDSSVAYQGAGRGLGMKAIRGLSDWASGGVAPDLTFLLNLDTDAGAGRVSQRGKRRDRIESAGSEFHERIHKAFQRIAVAESARIVPINACGSVKEIYEQTAEVVKKHIKT